MISTASPRRSPEFERRLHLFHARYIEEQGLHDLVDWPPGSFTRGGIGERDNHEMRPINTVLNALHHRALVLMGRMARWLGRGADGDRFTEQAAKVRAAMNARLFDESRGVYIDGEGSTHASLHANMMPLAMGVVPAGRVASVVGFIKSRGMACSVYGAQYLLEALYDHGEADHALSLMTARHDRGWWHMIEQGSTMTLEAWAHRYKRNLDWNHAWGTAPINIVARKLMGIEPISPGFERVRLRPQPGRLEHAAIRVPTPRGPIEGVYEAGHREKGAGRFAVTVPRGVEVVMEPSVAEWATVVERAGSPAV